MDSNTRNTGIHTTHLFRVQPHHDLSGRAQNPLTKDPDLRVFRRRAEIALLEGTDHFVQMADTQPLGYLRTQERFGLLGRRRNLFLTQRGFFGSYLISPE
ncbi:MAG: hypothetical protein RLZZ582_1607 [Verrucomicrobiota bacterium]